MPLFLAGVAAGAAILQLVYHAFIIRPLVNKIERMRYAGFQGDAPPEPPGPALPPRPREE